MKSRIFRKARPSVQPTAVNEVSPDKIQSSIGKGQSMDSNTESMMSARFGVDFSKVKIHADPDAANLNQQLKARAFTTGHDIFFNKGQFKPSSSEGKRLLAHELTHVVQQTKTNKGTINRNNIPVQRKEAPVVTEQVEGTLWAKDATGKDLTPSLEDISQGQVNDCFLFAAMAGIVNTDHQKIVNMIKDNGDGTYTVTFAGIKDVKSGTQTVTADFQVGKHGTVKKRKALWPLIIEKAYIKMKGGMKAMEGGGTANIAVKEMLDLNPTSFDPRTQTDDYIMGKVKQAIDKRWPIFMSTPRTKEGIGVPKKEMAEKSGLSYWHAYTVVAVDPIKKRIKLFNPWGLDDWNKDGWIDVELVRKFFIAVRYNSP